MLYEKLTGNQKVTAPKWKLTLKIPLKAYWLKIRLSSKLSRKQRYCLNQMTRKTDDDVTATWIELHLTKTIWTALTGSSKSTKSTSIKYLGPRFLSLQLPGSSLLLLDIVHACNDVLNTSDKPETTPRTEAVSILANLLCLPDDLSTVSVLQPEPVLTVLSSCPDIKVLLISALQNCVFN